MTSRLSFAIAIVAILFSCSGPQSVVRNNNLTPEEDLRNSVSILANDSLEGRGTGTSGEKKAGQWIADQFTAIGLQPKGSDGWFQSFSFKPHPPAQVHQVGDSTKLGMAVVKEITGRNVIGYLDNKAEFTVIIGAHYDHLGWGDENSLWTGGREIHNGADDNASGVSMLIQLARTIVSFKAYNKYNYLFMAFSGEEKGLWGSNYFCKNPTIDLTKVNYMLNMDMVGRLNSEKRLAINGVGTSPEWMKILPGLAGEMTLVTSESGVGPSDHTSFYNVNIPVLHFFTGQHEDYHKPSDDADKINISGMLQIRTMLLNLIGKLETMERIAFTKTKDETSSPSASAGDFKVTLGVIPDYLYDGQGMRIDGTKEGKPAHTAGLIKGDIVKKIGENEISDMKSYMQALSKFEKGQTTPVTIERNGETMVFQVTWQ